MTGVQTCALPILGFYAILQSQLCSLGHLQDLVADPVDIPLQRLLKISLHGLVLPSRIGTVTTVTWNQAGKNNIGIGYRSAIPQNAPSNLKNPFHGVSGMDVGQFPGE